MGFPDILRYAFLPQKKNQNRYEFSSPKFTNFTAGLCRFNQRILNSLDAQSLQESTYTIGQKLREFLRNSFRIHMIAKIQKLRTHRSFQKDSINDITRMFLTFL